MKNKKKKFKQLNSRIFLRYLLIIFVIIVVISFALFFYLSNKNKVNLSPSTILPQGFIPLFGYYHPFGGGKIGLWNSEGQNIIYNGATWSAINTPSGNGADGKIPLNFKPTVGYYYPFGDGAIVLWNADGKFISWNGATWSAINTPSGNGLDGKIPTGYKPVIGYYHEIGSDIGKGKISLWDANGRTFVGDSTGKFIQAPNFISKNNLPAGQAPKFAYYYDKGTKKEIHFWYIINGKLSWYIYNGATATLQDLTKSGLPSSLPTTGYYDKISNKIILWYANTAYESSDGASFKQSALITPPAACQKDLRYCSDGSQRQRDSNHNCEFFPACPEDIKNIKISVSTIKNIFTTGEKITLTGGAS